MKSYDIPTLPLKYDLETKSILRQLNLANMKLAELRGLAHTIPNENILINSLTLQEAKESSAVENIVTTHDALYKAGVVSDSIVNASTKEVLNYRQAILKGFSLVKKSGILSLNMIKEIQSVLTGTNTGFRSVPGTALRRGDGAVVYTPPQDSMIIDSLMSNLVNFINDDSDGLDPLIKLAIIHHQFESIHPFYDGNGRTGRIINILYLVISDRIDLPILYLSRYITHNKGEYYRLIQSIRDTEGDNSKEWENWILFILKGIEETAKETIKLVSGISGLMSQFKFVLRPLFGSKYKHELLNNLFFYPYTKLEYFQRDMMIQRITASKYLDMIVEAGLLQKVKVGRVNYYINERLVDFFVNRNEVADIPKEEQIESVQLPDDLILGGK